MKTNTVSLFDNEEEEDESDWNEPIFTPSKPTARNTLKVAITRSFRFPQFDSIGQHSPHFVCFSLSLLRSGRRPRARACSRTRSCCSATRSRRTTTRTSTSSPPQGKPRSVHQDAAPVCGSASSLVLAGNDSFCTFFSELQSHRSEAGSTESVCRR